MNAYSLDVNYIKSNKKAPTSAKIQCIRLFDGRDVTFAGFCKLHNRKVAFNVLCERTRMSILGVYIRVTVKDFNKLDLLDWYCLFLLPTFLLFENILQPCCRNLSDTKLSFLEWQCDE